MDERTSAAPVRSRYGYARGVPPDSTYRPRTQTAVALDHTLYAAFDLTDSGEARVRMMHPADPAFKEAFVNRDGKIDDATARVKGHHMISDLAALRAYDTEQKAHTVWVQIRDQDGSAARNYVQNFYGVLNAMNVRNPVQRDRYFDFVMNSESGARHQEQVLPANMKRAAGVVKNESPVLGMETGGRGGY